MQTYFIRRLLQGILVLAVTSIIIFVAIRILPGDPILTKAGATNVWSEEMAREQRHKFGLDKPVPVQYVDWLLNAFRGDFGISYFNQFSVTELIQRKWMATVELALVSLGLAILVGVPTGILAALKNNSWIDYLVSSVVTIGISIPGFWLGIMLVILFAVELKWLPPSGYIPINENPQANLRFLILPALTLAIILAAPIMRFLRASLLEVLNQDYIRTARGKGLTERGIVMGHAFRNALIPTITILGIIIGNLIAGVVIIEWVFSWPGIGWLAVDSIFKRDYAVVQAVTLLITFGVVLVNLFVDLTYGFLDPRIRYR
ncbi:MAG: ABC transporter permease [Anaerolineae bacterium]|nr:ABC transporter permease [Anaerolineae bacterium]